MSLADVPPQKEAVSGSASGSPTSPTTGKAAVRKWLVRQVSWRDLMPVLAHDGERSGDVVLLGDRELMMEY